MKTSAALFLIQTLPLVLAVPSPVWPMPYKSVKRDTPGVISMPITKHAGAVRTGARHLQRFDSNDKSLTALKGRKENQPPHQTLLDQTEYYMAEIGIGTPPQPQKLLVDTGGWVTWVNPDCAQAPRMAECLGLPAAYNPALSTPGPQKVPDMDQIIYYGAANGAALEGYADVFSWNDNATKVPGQAFGVANETIGLSVGILGLAPDGAQGFNSKASNFSVVATMANQKLISSRTFSLTYGGEGALVFGGVDKNHFKGPLRRTPIIPRDPIVDGWRYWASVTRVQHVWPNGTAGASLDTPGGVDNHIFNGTYMVDSGTTGVYVPRGVYDDIMREMNLTQDGLRAEGFPIVDCNMAKLNGSLSFSFAPSSTQNASSFDIHVPYSALMHPQRNRQTNETSCFFALSSGGPSYDDGDSFPILGVEFFKAAHVTFDWDNMEMGVAQGASCGEPDLVALDKGSLPSLVGNCK